MHEGYQVDPARLDQISKGLRDFQGQLQGASGGDSYGADVGTGLAGLSLTPRELGHEGLTSGWNEFVDTVDLVNRFGIAQLSGLIDGLGGSSRLYEQTEDYASGVLKDVYADGLGNPHLSDQQVEGKSWRQVAGDNPLSQMADVGQGWSGDAARQAGQQIGQTWSNEWADIGKTQRQHVSDLTGQPVLPDDDQSGSTS